MFRAGVGAEIVVVLVLVEVSRRSDCIIVTLVTSQGSSGFAFQTSFDKRFSGTVILVGEGQALDFAWWSIRGD